MHAASVIVLAWACVGAACFFSPASNFLVAAILTALVAVVGLPHGAADHRFARWKLEPVLGPAWLPAFLAGYVLAGSLVVCGWYYAAAETLVVFFLASAWHFGQEEPRLCRGPRWLRRLSTFARGGLPIWIPLLFQRAEVIRTLAAIAPHGLGSRGDLALSVLSALSLGMLGVASACWMLQIATATRSSGRKQRVLALDSMLIASFAILFAVSPPLISFLVYFCGWHSARGLARLRRELGETWLQLAGSLAPMTVTAAGLIAVLWWTVLGAQLESGSLIRTTFVGLSAVAMPHLILHGIWPLLSRCEPQSIPEPQPLGRPA